MRLLETRTGEAARNFAASSPPFGPGLNTEQASQTETLEVWASSFKDEGFDFCEFRAFDPTGTLITTRRLAGY